MSAFQSKGALTDDCAQSRMHRLIIFGVDGGTLEIVRPLAAKGLLPNFARIMEQGVAGELGSTFPPMTFPAFTTFMTGKNPGGHGVLTSSNGCRAVMGCVSSTPIRAAAAPCGGCSARPAGGLR